MNERFTELAKQAGFGSAWFEESKPGHPAMPISNTISALVGVKTKRLMQATLQSMAHHFLQKQGINCLT